MEKQENSSAYKLGYSITLNQEKLGFSLLNIIDKTDDREEALKMISDFSRGCDHARDRLRMPPKETNKEKSQLEKDKSR